MTITWQNLATVLIIVAATGYLLRYTLRQLCRKGPSGCGSCKKCPAKTPEKPLIDLEDRKKG